MSKTFSSEEQAEFYAERNYYPGTWEIKETIHGKWRIDRLR
jgi:hypothetical protein